MAGNRIKGITVEIGGDTTKLQTALKGVNTEIKNTQSQLRDVEKLLKLDPGNTELIAQKHKMCIRDSSSRLRSLCSVSTISLCSASYWSWEIVPFRSASSACCCAVFKVSSFSLVSETACASNLCFCAISSVFPGSSFRSFSTSFSRCV